MRSAPIENGFYYDVDSPVALKEDDLPKIEERMKELAALNQAIVRKVASNKAEAEEIILKECTLGQGEDVASTSCSFLKRSPKAKRSASSISKPATTA